MTGYHAYPETRLRRLRGTGLPAQPGAGDSTLAERVHLPDVRDARPRDA